jgi:hypothetical protein
VVIAGYPLEIGLLWVEFPGATTIFPYADGIALLASSIRLAVERLGYALAFEDNWEFDRLWRS